MALVVTLATLVLVTVAAMAFFVRATANRSIEVARSNNVLATEAAATAEAYTLFTLQKEIFANSSNITANGTTYYRPANATFMVPQRVPPVASFPAATFPSLVRRSVNETAGGVGETNASAHSTGTASRDGRLVTAARWNAPQLNRSPGFTTALVPNWIYISRNGTATATPPADAVGRFAYCIYDTSGLLDANHAGGGTATDLPAKGWLLNADIATSTNATIDATTLRQWRSGNLTAPELHTAWSQTGGLRPPSGGRQFSSRRDLLRALGTNSTAGLTGGIALAPDLTHFTRELHAPSLPFLNANATLGFPAAESNRFAAFYSTNNTFTGYSDNGTSFTYKLKAGAPVLHRRFSLGKLGRESGSGYQYWLTPTGPGAGISEAAIKAVFGLRWNSGQERWDYTSPDGNAPTDQIKTLAQVAAANRPPDFFEILKAGINPDSLGGRQTLNGATQLTLEEQARQGSTDLHVLRIGASMIDQADNDNYPTRLGFSLAGTDIEAAGVEDLPYLFGIALRTQYTRTRATDAQVTAAGGNSATQYGYFWDGVRVAMSPILFNPHRRGPVAASNPASLSFELLGGEVSDLGAIGAVQPPFLDLSRYTDTSLTPGSLAIPSAILTAFDSYRACPKNINNWGRLMNATISGVTVPNHLSAFTLPFGDPPPNGLVGAQPIFVSRSAVDAASSSTPVVQSIPDLPGFLKFKFAGLRIGLAYTSPNGQKRIYDSLAGSPFSGWGFSTGWLRAGFHLNYATTTSAYTTFTPPDNLGNNIGAFIKLDPRAPRYGCFFSYNTGNNDMRLAQFSADSYLGTGTVSPGEMPLGPNGAGTYTLADSDASQGYPGRNLDTAGATIFLPNRLFTGGTSAASGTSILNIPDRPQDGAPVIRPNDGFFSTTAGSANALQSEDGAYPYRAAPNDSPKRPVILQRPFRNVAELGHVYRDQPWKSLSFFHETSPDLALLDLFSIGEVEPVQVAGMVGTNSASVASLKSLLRGAGRTLSADATIYSATPTQAQADAVASNALTSLTANKSLTPAESLKTLVTAGNATITTNLGTIKAERETLARALAGSGQVRTWNVMIDTIAQTGRFPAGSTAAGDFLVGGEERLWIHAAIDRFTGEVTDLERESIPE